ncbi:MAG: SDR family NAD(P)-dependent oxidoreductase [Pseudomonadota bacterium]
MKILITGAAGFIGSHVSAELLRQGYDVVGIDSMNDYYSLELKRDRLRELLASKRFHFLEVDISDFGQIESVSNKIRADKILHLAAQAGVRYSIDHPHAYSSANLVGHFHLLELARKWEVDNFVYASSSSVYGGNTKVPFCETDQTDDPVSFYGATKKSNELMSHSYSSLYGLSASGLRFFTVYGPKGRPDMAYWIFADKIKRGAPIKVFNQGNMKRDFTYIDDIVSGTIAALEKPAREFATGAPHRIYNLGNDQPEYLLDLISEIESALNLEAKKQFMPIQKGDVPNTWAEISRARSELGFQPSTTLHEGIEKFMHWFSARGDRYK